MAFQHRPGIGVLGFSRNNGAVVELAASPKLQKAGDYSGQALKEVPVLAFFEHTDFQGASESTFVNWKNVGEWWADKVGSLVVFSGTWELFSEPDYRGDHWVLGPGTYSDVPFKIGSIRSGQQGAKQG